MGASRIETEYNEINAKNGWNTEFQVIFIFTINTDRTRKKNHIHERYDKKATKNII